MGWGDPDVLDRTLLVDGRPRTIIGVMPAEFRFIGRDPAAYLPFQFNRAELFVGNFSYQALARLRPGITIKQANADIARMVLKQGLILAGSGVIIGLVAAVGLTRLMGALEGTHG